MFSDSSYSYSYSKANELEHMVVFSSDLTKWTNYNEHMFPQRR